MTKLLAKLLAYFGSYWASQVQLRRREMEKNGHLQFLP
jgi:hypothetical protein